MARNVKQKAENNELLKLALKRFDLAFEADKDNREEALQDLEFVSGKQWPDEVLEQRKGRPCLTINRLPQFIRQVANEVRRQPPSINILVDINGNQKTAEVIEGLIRQIETKSKAKRVYAKALESACRCGMGFMRVKTDYESNDSFDQEIFIEYIRNPLGVLIDPDCIDPLARDAKFAFVVETMSVDVFKERYPGKQFDYKFNDEAFGEGWATSETIRVAEYWTIEEKKNEVFYLEDGRKLEKKQIQELIENGAQIPFVLDAENKPISRIVTERKVMSYIISGAEILEGGFEWAGDRIPIVPVWGEVYSVGDKIVRQSLINQAKDSMRSMNYWRSSSVEQLALAPKAPFMATAKQLQNHQEAWRNAGSSNPFVLPYDADPNAPPPQRQPPPPIQAAMLQEASQAQEDLKAITGIYDAALGARSNETSGRAIIARQQEGDISTYAFLDNLLSGVEEIGRIIVGLLPKIYDVPRQIRILGKKLEPAVIDINNEGGDIDFRNGKYDVHIETGASYTTQRQAAATAFQDLLKSAPQLTPVLLPRLIQMLDVPDADEISQELMRLFQPSPPPEQPNPKDTASAQKMSAETEKIQAETMQLIRDMGLAQSLGQNVPQGMPNFEELPPQMGAY